MKAQKCNNCDYETIVDLAFCPKCQQQAFDEISVPNEGTVYSFTTIRIAPPEYIKYAPYQVALVALTDQLKVTAFIQEEVAIGDIVALKEVRDNAYVFEVKK